jgi:hypothetical protein
MHDLRVGAYTRCAGAVLYGLQPATITARRSRLAYGVCVDTAVSRLSLQERAVMDSTQTYTHPEHGERHAEDYFSRYVAVGLY